MKKILVMLMMLGANLSNAKDCLPNKMRYVKDNPKYLVKTVKADTHSQAQFKLRNQMPQAGFLKTIKHTEVKELSSQKFLEQKRLEKSLKANVDLWLTYSCKHNSEYYATAVVPVEGINYVDDWYPKDFWNLKNVKKVCKDYNKIVLFASRSSIDFAWSSDKAIKYSDPGRKRCGTSYGDKTCHWYIFCGNVKLKTPRKYISNDFDNFIVVQSYKLDKYSVVKDVTVDYWLELTKDF